MQKNRLEAFSDGVLAIIITIMVLELKTPKGLSFSDLGPLVPVLLSYFLSFVYVAIYWNNHHHLFHAVRKVNGGVLWANMHLLFWLSLTPFVTAWAGEHNFAGAPVAAYGCVLMMAGISYYILTRVLLAYEGENSLLAKALGADFKGKISVIIYAVSIPVAFWMPVLSLAAYGLVAVMWIIPDRRIERQIHS